MREIKFRAWDKDNKGYIVEPTAIYGEHVMVVRGSQLVSVPNAVALQYTGLRDKNDKEIYEGDIVRDDTWGNGEVRFGSFMVEGGDYYSNFCHAGWCVKFKGGDDETSDLDPRHEVIGNVYQNPGLLGDAEKAG